MRKRNVDRKAVLQQMMALAAGRANDAVKLAYLPEEALETLSRLDLGCLTEFKRSSNGAVEVKLTDRAAVLVKLLEQLKDAEGSGTAAFLEALRREGWSVKKAENDVLSGIRLTADALKSGKVVICTPCADAIREFGAYCWDLRSGERDKVKKVCDHAMDEIRYFVATIVAGEESGAQFFVGAVERRGW